MKSETISQSISWSHFVQVFILIKNVHVYVHQTLVPMRIVYWEHHLSLHFMASVCIRLSQRGTFHEFQGIRIIIRIHWTLEGGLWYKSLKIEIVVYPSASNVTAQRILTIRRVKQQHSVPTPSDIPKRVDQWFAHRLLWQKKHASPGRVFVFLYFDFPFTLLASPWSCSRMNQRGHMHLESQNFRIKVFRDNLDHVIINLYSFRIPQS